MTTGFDSGELVYQLERTRANPAIKKGKILDDQKGALIEDEGERTNSRTREVRGHKGN